MLSKHFSFLITGIFCLFSITSFAATTQSPEDYITSQQIIRIYIENAAGYGDQAASMNAMAHIRKLGFRGRFEVIYPNDVLTKKKVVTLFGLPTDIPGDYIDTEKNNRFINSAEQIIRIQQNQLPPISLAINGGMGPPPCLFDIDCGPAKNNSLAFLGADNLLVIGPFTHYPSYVYFKNNPTQGIVLPNSDAATKFFTSDSPSLTKIREFLNHDTKGQALLKQKPALATLIKEITNQKINFLPVYGFSIQDPSRYPEENNINAYHKLLEIIAGARYAQLHGDGDAANPLIITAFYDYTVEAMQFKQLLHSPQWGKYETPYASAEREIIKNLALDKILSFADIADPNTVNKIQSLKPNEILLLWLGPLPKNVFDGLYNHTDTNVWPAIREGASSLNSQLLTGKPHFRCASNRSRGLQGRLNWEIGYDLIQDLTFKDRLMHFYDHFCVDDDASAWTTNHEIYIELGKLIIDSLHTNSPIAAYFTQLKAEALKPENDKVRYDIEQMLLLM